MDDSERWVRHRGFLPDFTMAEELGEQDEELAAPRRRHRRLKPRPARRRLKRRPVAPEGGPQRQMSDRD